MKFKAVTRKILSISPTELVKVDLMQSEQRLLPILQPSIDGISLVKWVASNQRFIETQLLQYGGILFRNFQIKLVSEFENFIRAISGELIEYSYCSTPRSKVGENIYSSTEYPADQFIPLHNEMAYSSSWPMKIWFFCMEAANQGGETPIADSRKVFKSIDPRIKEHFHQKKIMYVRNYSEGLDLKWENVFQTNQRSEVEAYCRHAGIDFEWKDGNHLRTCQVCQAVATHPKTGEDVWFNQAHLFHVSSLKSEVRDFLLSSFNELDLPRNAYYGDGSPIEPSILEEIRHVYRQESFTFAWQKSDILMLDNMLMAHGRMPFSGPRKVVVGMADPL